MTSFRHEGGKFRRSSLSTRRSNVAAALAREPLLDGQQVDEEAAPGAQQQQVQGRRGRSRALEEEKPPSTGWSGEYVKSIVYGGLDAIVTSFALVASVSGGDLPAGACARASLAVYVCVCVSLSPEEDFEIVLVCMFALIWAWNFDLKGGECRGGSVCCRCGFSAGFCEFDCGWDLDGLRGFLVQHGGERLCSKRATGGRLADGA